MKTIRLSDEFYREYENCKEILKKPSRPYLCLAVKINGCTFAIPFRHRITHKHAFITYENRGLDYSKAVVISNRKYISERPPQIEQHEFNALKGNDNKIYNGMCNYIKLYKKALQYKNSPHYANIILCSALQYFEEFL